MTKSAPAPLPAPLTAYFAAHDHRDTASLFAPDAVVRDEGQTHAGAAAIAAWLDRVETSYHPRYAVKAVESADGRTIVTFEVSGTFPGSPVTLRQAFTVADGYVQRLETL